MTDIFRFLPFLKSLKSSSWRLQSKLQLLLMATSLGTLLLAGGISWYLRKLTITNQVENQLTNTRIVKTEQIESEFENLYNQVWMLSQDIRVIRAMIEFNEFFQHLNVKDIPSQWKKTVENYYAKEFIPQLIENSATENLKADFYLPTNQASQYLQYYYIADNPNPENARNQLLDPGDGSSYTQAHINHHKLFKELCQKLGYQDLYLINHKTGDIVYSVNKQVNFATNTFNGYQAQSGLAQLLNAIKINPIKDTIQIADFTTYQPSHGLPAMFLGIPIYSGVNVVGILAVQLSPERINTIIDKSKNWKKEGLGETGEVYLVGADFLMRSDSRLFSENPQKYTRKIAEYGTEPKKVTLSEKLGTTVALHKSQTLTTRKALSGEEGIQRDNNYIGSSVISSYAPLKLPGLNWAILANMDTAEVYQPMYRLGMTLLIGGVIFSLLSSFLSALAAKWLTRPLKLVSDHIKNVLEDKSDKMMLEVTYQDEYKELTEQVNNVLGRLYDNTIKLQRKEQESNTFLENILPQKIAERWRRQEKLIVDNIQQITIVSARIAGLTDISKDVSSKDQVELLNKLFTEFDQQALKNGLEIQSSEGANYLAVCGLTKVYFDNLQRSIQFALAMLETVQVIKQKYSWNIGITIGVHTGSVTGGVIGNRKFDYRIWGETLFLANTLRDFGEIKYVTITKEVFEGIQDKYTIFKNTPIQLNRYGQLDSWSILNTSTILPATEVDLLQSSFEKILDRAYRVGEVFYDRLFTLEPLYRNIFKIDMSTQTEKFISTLRVVVEGLRNQDTIIPAIRALGKRHVNYNVEDTYYAAAGEALIWTLKKELGEDFTPPVQRAWEKAYEFVSVIMIEATNEEKERLSNPDIGL